MLLAGLSDYFDGFYARKYDVVSNFGKIIDPIADNPKDVVNSIDEASIILYAHNRYITYGYTGQYTKDDTFYCDIPEGSVIVDPWRNLPKQSNKYEVIHYGNTRTK